MSVPMKICTVPGCGNEFPEHYFGKTCGSHKPQEMIEHGGYVEWTNPLVVGWLDDWMEEKVYWEESPRALARRYRPGITQDELGQIKEVPWVEKASVGNRTIRIYFDISPACRRWGFSLQQEWGDSPESEITWGFSRGVAKWKAVQAASLSCGTCGADVTFDWRSTSFIQNKDGSVTMGESTCRKCFTREQVDTWKDTGKIRTDLTTTVVLELQAVEEFGRKPKYPEYLGMFREIRSSLERIGEKVKQFEREVWFSGLQKKIRANTHSGESVTLPSGVEVRSLAMCGRWRSTLEHPEGFHIDIICAEDSDTPTMGLNYINCSERQAIALLDDAITAWKDGTLNFEQAHVGIGI